MTQPAFVTRADAAKPPRQLIDLMCRAAYTAGRPTDSQRPEYDNTSLEWRGAMHHEMTAAVMAAQAAGYRLSAP